MALFSKEFNSFDELLLHELRDLYDAELRICDALPQMADAADSQELKSCFEQHLRETTEQVNRLEQIFQQLGESASRETCEGIKGIIDEGDEIVKAKGDPAVKDAGLIAAAQRVEHYEIAAYGSARTFARRLGLNGIADLLQKSLDEEGEADKKLTDVAEHSVNLQAAHAS